jgi:hypothetical protein
MARKITISVPDELYEKMKSWKPLLNFSKIFQLAVSGIIQKKEALTSKIRSETDLTSIVTRLRKEKIDHELNVMEWGRRDGLEWCKTAHYREIQYALCWRPHQNPYRDEQLGEYFFEKFEQYKKRLTSTGQNAQEWLNLFSDRYIRGWKESVESFWEEVKDKL